MSTNQKQTGSVDVLQYKWLQVFWQFVPLSQQDLFSTMALQPLALRLVV